ncbi:cell agglutination protein Mam3 [Tilletia horrida]|nr:cell agglutination protein Mam3 [Tilletia horrida]
MASGRPAPASDAAAAASASATALSYYHRPQAALRLGVLGVLSSLSLLSALLKPVLASPLFLPFAPSLPTSPGENDWLNVNSHPHHDDEDAPRTPLKLTLDILSIAGLVLLGGVFAGLTLGLMGLDPINLQVLSTSGTPKEQKNALKVLRLLERGRHWVLVVLLLGNVIVNETLPVFLSDFGGGLAAVLTSTVLIVIFGEIVPQSICARHGLAIGAFCAPLVHVTMILFAPIAWPTAKLLDYCLGEEHGTTYRKAELKTLVSLHAQLGTEHLNDDEVTIIRAVLDLNDKTVEDVMTPIDDVWTLSHDEILNEATINRIIHAGYSRIPIHEPGQPDAILGMLLVKKLISYDPEDALPVSYFQLTPLPEATPDLNCFDALTYFRSGRSHLLLISETPGEAGGAIGIVTLEDVVEELLGGEIIDETDYYVDVHQRTRVVRPRPREDSKGHEHEANIQPLIRGIIERRRKLAGSDSPFRKSFGLPSTAVTALNNSSSSQGVASPRAFVPTAAPGFPRTDTNATSTGADDSVHSGAGAPAGAAGSGNPSGGKYGAVGSMTPAAMSRAASRAKPVNPKVPLRHRPGSPSLSNAGSSYASELNNGFALPDAAMEETQTQAQTPTPTQPPSGKKTSWFEAALSQAALTGTRNLSRSRTIEDSLASPPLAGGRVGASQRFSRRSIPDNLNGAGGSGSGNASGNGTGAGAGAGAGVVPRRTSRTRSVDSHAGREHEGVSASASASGFESSQTSSGFSASTAGASSAQAAQPQVQAQPVVPEASSSSEAASAAHDAGASQITPGTTLPASAATNLSTLSENPTAEERAAAADATDDGNDASAAVPSYADVLQADTVEEAKEAATARSGPANGASSKVVVSSSKIATVEAALRAHREREEREQAQERRGSTDTDKTPTEMRRSDSEAATETGGEGGSAASAEAETEDQAEAEAGTKGEQDGPKE